MASLPEDSGWYVSERNLNDGSVEGLRHRELPAFSVQYHPEGAPGPQDRAGVFDEFLRMCVRRTGGTGTSLAQTTLRGSPSRNDLASRSVEPLRELATSSPPPARPGRRVELDATSAAGVPESGAATPLTSQRILAGSHRRAKET